MKKTLEEEKKLVAEKLMGWKSKWPKGGLVFFVINRNDLTASFMASKWNPHKDRNCWPEMFEKMSEEQRRLFIDILFAQFVSEREAKGMLQCPLGKMYWLFLTVPTKRLWKTVIKTLTTCAKRPKRAEKEITA